MYQASQSGSQKLSSWSIPSWFLSRHHCHVIPSMYLWLELYNAGQAAEALAFTSHSNGTTPPPQPHCRNQQCPLIGKITSCYFLLRLTAPPQTVTAFKKPCINTHSCRSKGRSLAPKHQGLYPLWAHGSQHKCHWCWPYPYSASLAPSSLLLSQKMAHLRPTAYFTDFLLFSRPMAEAYREGCATSWVMCKSDLERLSRSVHDLEYARRDKHTLNCFPSQKGHYPVSTHSTLRWPCFLNSGLNQCMVQSTAEGRVLT